MTVNEIKPDMLCLEYKQDKSDKDYGSCLWARFMFNLDRYELLISSDCGNYGYKWYETPNSESFIELMARCNKWYILNKIYGSEDIFNYESTKERIYEIFGEDDLDREKLDEIFEEVELYGEPDSAAEFMRVFEDNNNNDFTDVWEYVQYDYPANALKIASVFDECIRPKLKEILTKKYDIFHNK